MKNKLLLILLVLLFPPTLSATEVTRTLQIEFAFTIPDNLKSQLQGYRLYKEGEQAYMCQYETRVAVSTISCNIPLGDDTFNVVLTAYYDNGDESQRSRPFPINPSTASATEPLDPVELDDSDNSPTPAPLLAVIDPTPTSGEIPLYVSFTGLESTGDIASYTWEFGDGTPSSEGYLAYHTYSTPAEYTATLTIADQSGATHQVSTTITALPNPVGPQPPTAVFSSSTTANTPNVVNFDGTASTTTNPPIVNYSWDFGDGIGATGEITSHFFTAAGTYYTTLTVEDSKGLTNSFETPIIVIGSVEPVEPVEPNVKPTALISTNPPGGNAPITISFDGSNSSDPDGSIGGYSWDFGDGTTGSGQMTQHTYTNGGIYTVSLLVTDDKGDTGTATSQIACNTTLPALELNLEAGEVTVDHNWEHVLFENSFSQPIVVAGPPSSDDIEPVLVRIRNIDQQGFEVRLQEWDYQDGSHASETFSYIVMEKGTFTLANGSKVEAGSFNGTTSLQQVTLQQTYDYAPIILSQVITANEADAVTGRISNVLQSSFAYKLQEQETTSTSHTTETIGYIAWEPGKGEIDNLLYEAGTTSDSVTQYWTDIAFQTEFPDLPLFIAGMQTTDGGDTATVRSQSMSQLATQIKIEEEQSKDAEIAHTTEVVGYLAIGSKTAPTEQPTTSTSTEKKFTFTWDYGDTQNVSGFRFYLNGSLLCETTNPDDRQITCYAALLNDTMAFTMTAVFLDGTEGTPSNLLTINPADYPELFGIRLVTLSWEYDDSMENTISGFRIYNNEQLVCETTDVSARQISCKTPTQNTANNFRIAAIELSGPETSPSNDIQYNP
jgi:PKD repeat protein